MRLFLPVNCSVDVFQNTGFAIGASHFLHSLQGAGKYEILEVYGHNDKTFTTSVIQFGVNLCGHQGVWVVHGGCISTVIDELFQWTAYWTTGRIGYTANLNVNYRRPLPVERPGLSLTTLQGDESLRGRWMSQGPILERMDMLGAAIACKYDNVPSVLCLFALLMHSMRASRATQGGCATVSFDQVESHVPVYHGDLFQLEGQILNINNTSTSIHISGYRVDMLTGTTTHTHDAILTFVAIDKNGRPRSGLPKLVSPLNPTFVPFMYVVRTTYSLPIYTTDMFVICWQRANKAAQRKELGARWRKIQEEVDAMEYIRKDMLDVNPLNASRTTFVPVKATLVEVQNLFLPKHLNMNNTIFGGEILQWMVAVFCARKFTKNVHMATITMNRIVFQLPITTNDVVSMKARVVMARCVR
ncbi:hypothetical protein B5M09_011499 [Aphanomyces astaci]|uniref:HotDog ACOT-type domain-containing protein n=1 Tax=Aphanomyces astaci TaxID=112090 RepID=A0A3R7W6A8_APHAT|nr:hypothetical protein B5M09_011499 [Aphanomyces astaci]